MFDNFFILIYNKFMTQNVVLIGMPSSGKSACGKLLAKRLGLGFIDSDLVIEGIEQKSLPKLIEEQGAEKFIEIEARINSGLDVMRCVIATGGSAVYSDHAMQKLKERGVVVYLKIDAEEIKKRIPDLVLRGVVMHGNCACVDDLYLERVPLYEKYQDITIDCNKKSIEEIVEEITTYITEKL